MCRHLATPFPSPTLPPSLILIPMHSAVVVSLTLVAGLYTKGTSESLAQMSELEDLYVRMKRKKKRGRDKRPELPNPVK